MKFKSVYIDAFVAFIFLELVFFILSFLMAAAGAGNPTTGVNLITATIIYVGASAFVSYRNREYSLTHIFIFAVCLCVLKAIDVVISGMTALEYFSAAIYIFICSFVGFGLSKFIVLLFAQPNPNKLDTPKSERNAAPVEQLLKLKTLLDSGAITQQEFDDLKRKLLTKANA